MYLEYLISGSLNIMFSLKSPAGELLGLIYSYQCLVFALLLLPVYLLYLFLVPKEKFDGEKFANEEGMIYRDEVKTDTKLE